MSVRASAFFGTPTPCVAATPRSPRSPSRSGSPTSRATSTLDQDGTLVARDRGTPQGSAVSPVLANLYLHYASMCGWPGNIRQEQYDRDLAPISITFFTQRLVVEGGG